MAANHFTGYFIPSANHFKLITLVYASHANTIKSGIDIHMSGDSK